MGQNISKLFRNVFLPGGKENLRILMVGLDGAGKTTILRQLSLGEIYPSIPTVGFNVEIIEYKNLRFTVWDVGGQQRIRRLWHHYYQNTAAVVYVIDSADRDRLMESAEELHGMLDHPELRHAVILVLANKRDMPDVLSLSEIAKRLGLHLLQHQWQIKGICANSGSGLGDSLEYLRELLAARKYGMN